MTPETIEDVENNISDFEKAVARAEELSKAARHAAEASTKVAMEGTRHAEQIGKEAREAAELAARAAQEAVARAEKVSREAKEAADAAIKAANEAIAHAEEVNPEEVKIWLISKTSKLPLIY